MTNDATPQNATATAAWHTAEPALREVPSSLAVALQIKPLVLDQGGLPAEIAQLPCRLTFVRKPVNLDEVIYKGERSIGDLAAVHALGMVVLTSEQFDEFAGTLLATREWLGKVWEDCWRRAIAHRAHEVDARLCVLVTAEGRPVVAIDTQGATYARYAAVVPSVVYAPQALTEEAGPLPPMEATWDDATASMRQVLAGIARRHLGMETLDTRQSDRLDFREVSVWGVRDALLFAYSLGFADAAATFGD